MRRGRGVDRAEWIQVVAVAATRGFDVPQGPCLEEYPCPRPAVRGSPTSEYTGSTSFHWIGHEKKDPEVPLVPLWV